MVAALSAPSYPTKKDLDGANTEEEEARNPRENPDLYLVLVPPLSAMLLGRCHRRAPPHRPGTGTVAPTEMGIQGTPV